MTDPMVPNLFNVQRIRKETHDTYTIEVKPEARDKPFTFAPGQFNMLYVFGKGEVPISISGDPGNPDKLIHTLRAVGNVTQSIAQLKKGDSLGVRGPYGSHWPIEQSYGKDIVIVAGGIGLAPLRPAIYQIIDRRDHFANINILYGTRTPKDILFQRELEQWRGRFDMNVQVTVDTTRRGWAGHVGVVPKLISKINFDPTNTSAMICGPEIMMRFTIPELTKRGLPVENIYVSMERNMKCAVGFCGHCQYGPTFICKDGPVFPLDRIQTLFAKREL